LHILCFGWNYHGSEIWWDRPIVEKKEIKSICMNISKYVFSSAAFLAIKNPLTLEKGFQIRTIVWLLFEGHGFAIGWNFHTIGANLHCIVFPIDLLDKNPFVEELLPLFCSELQTKFDCIIAKKLDSLVEVGDIKFSEDFPCVPFLARATLYVSMLDSLGGFGDIYSLARKLDLDTEKKLYHLFEKTMLEFTESEVKHKKCIFLPPKLITEKFININDFYLESMDSSGSSTRYEFNGFTHGFVDSVGLTDCACPVQACFFDVMDKVRQCQALVIWTQLRITSAKSSKTDIQSKKATPFNSALHKGHLLSTSHNVLTHAVQSP
jgi:hypothetical protein